MMISIIYVRLLNICMAQSDWEPGDCWDAANLQKVLFRIHAYQSSRTLAFCHWPAMMSAEILRIQHWQNNQLCMCKVDVELWIQLRSNNVLEDITQTSGETEQVTHNSSERLHNNNWIQKGRHTSTDFKHDWWKSLLKEGYHREIKILPGRWFLLLERSQISVANH